MQSILSVQGLSKKYRLGERQSSYETLRERLSRSFRAPFSIGQRLNRSSGDDWFWALSDVSFDVRPGEVIGIIGRNGAGKSTLLKILSRITEPTSGRAEIHGRVGSLLEVGTGFHPELTGRENVYLNGAILGMARREINRKFDEIVSFAEIDRFLDTAVKYYSTGMYMRLAFAVAAHLEPDILIVDEVLAVGDAAFQKKCVNKMGAAAFEGRTVLFVSHNVAAMRALCKRGILIENGKVEVDADIDLCVAHYMAEHDAANAIKVWSSDTAPQTAEIRLEKAYIANHGGKIVSHLDYRQDFLIAVEYEVLKPVRNLRVGFSLQTGDGTLVCGSNDPSAWPQAERKPGRYVSRCVFPGSTLNAGNYVVSFGSDSTLTAEALIYPRPSLNFVIEMREPVSRQEIFPGVIRPTLKWNVEKME